MRKLWNFEMVKTGQNLHANMEGFHRAGHIYTHEYMYICVHIEYIPIREFSKQLAIKMMMKILWYNKGSVLYI